MTAYFELFCPECNLASPVVATQESELWTVEDRDDGQQPGERRLAQFRKEHSSHGIKSRPLKEQQSVLAESSERKQGQGARGEP